MSAAHAPLHRGLTHPESQGIDPWRLEEERNGVSLAVVSRDV